MSERGSSRRRSVSSAPRDLTRFAEADCDHSEAFTKLMASPNIASKRWVYSQYDTTVRTGTAIRPGGDAGVVRLRGDSQGRGRDDRL